VRARTHRDLALPERERGLRGGGAEQVRRDSAEHARGGPRRLGGARAGLDEREQRRADREDGMRGDPRDVVAERDCEVHHEVGVEPQLDVGDHRRERRDAPDEGRERARARLERRDADDERERVADPLDGLLGRRVLVVRHASLRHVERGA
jgi:hypothetical protein